MYKSILYLITILLLSSFGFGQNKQIEKKIDEFLSKQFNQADPGCVVLAAKEGKIIYRKAFGSADLQLNVPLNADMVFNIASITKQFTAVAILQLVEQGQISIQDSVQKFVPGYPWKGYTITIENLLTHTSGIRDYLQIDYETPFLERWDFEPGQLIDSFKTYPLDFKPGTKFSYSNSGYYLLGYIIEKISGKKYQDYIRENILQPLGMVHTYFDQGNKIIPNRVSGYRKEGATFKNVDYWSPTIEYSAGGLISSVEDLFTWQKGLYSYKILRKETLEKAFISYHLENGTETGYGYGWFIKTSNGINSIEHQGGLPGFESDETYFPAEDIFISILCNSGTAPIDELSVTIASIMLNKPMQQEIRVDEKLLDKYVGIYQLTTDTNRKMTIFKKNGGLVAKISDTDNFPLIFQSETKFQFKNVLNADCEFVIENGRVTKFNVSQSGHFEWIRIQ
jgi:CubicO group peptidase (beta-lactamase class C family)